MLSESFGTPKTTWRRARLREAQVDADRLLAAIASALAADGELLSADERARDRRAGGRAARRARPAADRAAIERSLKALAKATEAFAAERMNRGIRRALAGRRVEDV